MRIKLSLLFITVCLLGLAYALLSSYVGPDFAGAVVSLLTIISFVLLAVLVFGLNNGGASYSINR